MDHVCCIFQVGVAGSQWGGGVLWVCGPGSLPLVDCPAVHSCHAPCLLLLRTLGARCRSSHHSSLRRISRRLNVLTSMATQGSPGSLQGAIASWLRLLCVCCVCALCLLCVCFCACFVLALCLLCACFACAWCSLVQSSSHVSSGPREARLCLRVQNPFALMDPRLRHVPVVLLSLPCCCGCFSATHLCTLPGTRALPKSVVTPPRAQDEEDLDFVDWHVEIERPVERGALALGSAHSVHGVLCVQSMVCEHSRGL